MRASSSVDEVRALVGPEDVPRMAVAVEPDVFEGKLECFVDQGQRLLPSPPANASSSRADEIVREQPRALLVRRSSAFGFAMLEFLRCAHRMDARDEAADPFQRPGIVELGRAAAAAG